MDRKQWDELHQLCMIYPSEAALLSVVAKKYGWTLGKAYIVTAPFRFDKKDGAFV